MQVKETKVSERRRAKRQRSFLRGCIYFNKHRNAVDCLIRDISDDGARVIFSDAVSIPDLVDIYIPQKEQMLRARVQWRRGEELGLSFVNIAGAAAESPDIAALAQRLARLESEVAALRRLLRQLKREFPSTGEEAA